MEIIEKNNSGRMAPLGAVLLAAGVALLGWSLWALPHEPAYGFPWAFLLAVGGLKLILFGGHFLGSLLSGRAGGSYRSGHHGGIPFALTVIVAGALLMGFNSGVLAAEWKRVFFSWQMLLIVIGLAEYTRMHMTGGTVLVAVGGFFIVRKLAAIYPDIAQFARGDMWWPVLLIVAGVLVLGGMFLKPGFGGCRNHRGHHRRHNHCGAGQNRRCKHGGERHDGEQNNGERTATDGADDADDAAEGDMRMNMNRNGRGYRRNARGGGSRNSGVIDIEVVFGGSEQVCLDPVFRGGKIATVFGGVKLDLRRTRLPEGDTHLWVESIFGGVEIDVPEEWVVEIRGESIFGGFNDKRLPPVGEAYTEGRKLVVIASSIFGGGEIK